MKSDSLVYLIFILILAGAIIQNIKIDFQSAGNIIFGVGIALMFVFLAKKK